MKEIVPISNNLRKWFAPDNLFIFLLKGQHCSFEQRVVP